MLATTRGATALRTRPVMKVSAIGSPAVSMHRGRSPLTGSKPAPARFTGLPARPLPAITISIGAPSSPLSVEAVARLRTVARSFLGVGAPEALLVAVVALVVFGPKGLADAAKSVGTALRAFQPTIREVVEVSQDLKGTLEKELGLDEIRAAATMPPPRPKPISSSAEDDPEIEAKRAASAAAAWGGAPQPAAGEPQPVVANVPQQLEQPAAAAPAAAAPAAAAPAKDLNSLSMEELEAELARRKAAGQQQQQRSNQA